MLLLNREIFLEGEQFSEEVVLGLLQAFNLKGQLFDIVSFVTAILLLFDQLLA